MSSTNRLYTLRNNKTGKEHTVNEDGMKKLKELKWETKYTIVDERVVVGGPKTTMIPDEIREGQAGAQRAIKDLAGEGEPKEQPTRGRKASGQ